MKLEGKVAVVTGAGSGLGLESCRALARRGARIVGFDIDAAKLERLSCELGEPCVVRVTDVADERSVEDGLEAAINTFGAIHILVNCAGVEGAARTVSKGQPFPIELWNKVIAVNLTGSFNLIRLGSARMIDNAPDEQGGERGVIINTSSGAATQGQIGQAAYSASKAGLIGLTLPVARDLARHAIRVVTIAPGVFETPMVANLPPEVTQSLIDKTVLFPKRMGRPQEFGALVAHIAENAYFNATTIDLDAGARMTAS